MSQRLGLQITCTAPTEPSVSPNLYIPEVSAHVRLYWPPQATWEEVEATMSRAFEQALEIAYDRYHGPQPPQNSWMSPG